MLEPAERNNVRTSRQNDFIQNIYSVTEQKQSKVLCRIAGMAQKKICITCPTTNRDPVFSIVLYCETKTLLLTL